MEYFLQLLQINERNKFHGALIDNHRIDLYTIDKLMELAERIDLEFDIKVA